MQEESLKSRIKEFATFIGICLAIVGVVVDYKLWHTVIEQVRQTIPAPFPGRIAFVYPEPPKRIVLKSKVVDRLTGQVYYGLLAEDNTLCKVDKETYETFKLGDTYDCVKPAESIDEKPATKSI